MAKTGYKISHSRGIFSTGGGGSKISHTIFQQFYWERERERRKVKQVGSRSTILRMLWMLKVWIWVCFLSVGALGTEPAWEATALIQSLFSPVSSHSDAGRPVGAWTLKTSGDKSTSTASTLAYDPLAAWSQPHLRCRRENNAGKGASEISTCQSSSLPEMWMVASFLWEISLYASPY